MDDLELIVKGMLDDFNFNYATIKEATKYIKINDYEIEYNATTLVINNCNEEIYRNLTKVLKKEFNKRKYSNEIIKERKERIVLNQFIQLSKIYMDYQIVKQERPDFVLRKDGIVVGVEVTELTDVDSQVINSIIREIIGKGLSKEEVEKFAISKHGKKAMMYEYSDVNGSNAISGPMFDVDKHKKLFVENIEKKFKKYEDVASEYDKFIVLCFTDGIEIINSYDVDDLVNMIKYKPKNPIYVALIYKTSDSYYEDSVIDIRQL